MALLTVIACAWSDTHFAVQHRGEGLYILVHLPIYVTYNS